jgi:2-dehydro-3-deoxy-L-rhamnonate dehydrogenase (NAD+)
MAKPATKTAIVTGGAGGVARALLPMLIAEGYRVALIDVNEAGLAKCAAEHGERVLPLPCNLTDLGALAAALEKARAAFGTLDLLVNNAGVTTTGPFAEIDPASIPRDIATNLVAPLHIIRTITPWMRSPGAIVNTISMASIIPLSGSSVYSATKFGLRGFSIALHMELKPRGITVSGVLPSAIDTPMLLKETREGATALNFLSDPLPPEKVAKAILRAAREGKIEYYVPYSDRILSSLALFFPSLIPTIYPWFEKMGVKRQKAYLASRAKDSLPEGTPIPERERADVL